VLLIIKNKIIMAKIFSVPKEIKVPKLDWNDIPSYDSAEKKFIKDLAEFLKTKSTCEHVGEELLFPYADSYARYMVFSINPLQLIHLPLGDAWEYPYIERLTATDILNKINQQKSLLAFFGSK